MKSSRPASFDRLKIAKLPIPADVYKKAEELCDNYNRMYLETIEEFEDRLLLRTFAYSKTKKNGLRVCEICRRLEGCNPMIDNCYPATCGGYVTLWGEWEEGYEMSKNSCWFFSFRLYDPREIENKYSIRCHYDNSVGCSFFNYLCMIRKEPKIEYIVKNGYGSMIKSYKRFKPGRNFQDIFGVDKKWANFLKGKSIIYLEIIKNFKVNSPEEVEEIYKLRNKNKSLYKIIDRKNPGRFIDYISKIDTGIYLDYRRFMADLGYPEENKFLYPDNLALEHDRLEKDYYKKKARIRKKEFEAQYKKNAKLNFISDELMILCCRQEDELINESKCLNHCVRSYADRVAKGETAIYFIRHTDKPDDPFVTLELSKKRIVQVRAKNNSRPETEVFDFLDKWKKEYHLRG